MEKKPEQEKEKQQTPKTERSGEEKKKNNKEMNLEGLPVEDRPYFNYKDFEDYKLQGYGTQDHLKPTLARGASATDAPPPSGATIPSKPDVSATDVINHREVP